MKIKKEQLGERICDVLGRDERVSNTETYREFIRNSEEEFGMEEADIDNMSDDELNKYLDFLDYLWEK